VSGRAQAVGYAFKHGLAEPGGGEPTV
jgi:hypothetical protein